MRTLCIDTSDQAVLTVVEDGVVTGHAVEPHPRRHAESLGVLLQHALDARPDEGGVAVDRICVGTGPGPYTGLRAGLAFATALGRALDVPVLGIPSQEALARGALDSLEEEVGAGVLVTSDAKRGEVYWGIYRSLGANDVVAVAGPNVGPLEEAHEAALAAGVSVTEATIDPAVFVRIADSRLERDCRTEFPLEPLYLRRPDVNVKGAK